MASLLHKGFDVMTAEEAVSQAFQKALDSWAKTGSPDAEEAWLMTVALRCAIDVKRKEARTTSFDSVPEPESEPDYNLQPLEDERLRLFFLCTHPAIDDQVQTPLMLQLILGMTVAEISELLILPESQVAQRLVRAKKKLKLANLTLELPHESELDVRSAAVLQAIYGLYTRGWDLPGSSVRMMAAKEAMELAELMAGLLPSSAEALGLASLILFCESRRSARLDALGDYVPLSDQDFSQWDWALVRKAEELLGQAALLRAPGRFQLEASIQSAHVQRLTRGEPGWETIVVLYRHLVSVAPTQSSRIGLAAALAYTSGPQAALDDLEAGGFSDGYQPFHSLRCHLLVQLGRSDEALESAKLAVSLTADPAVKGYFSRLMGNDL